MIERTASALAALMILLIGCGGGKSAGPAARPTTVSPQTGASSAPEPEPAPPASPAAAVLPADGEPLDPKDMARNCSVIAGHTQRGEWARAEELMKWQLEHGMRRQYIPSAEVHSDCYSTFAQIAYYGGDLHMAAEYLVNALEIRPENLFALREFVAFARDKPDAYDFKPILKQLDRVYRERKNQDGLRILADEH